MNKEQKIPVVLLLSYGHSGSTLMDIMVDASPEIVGVGELFQLKNSLKFDLPCSCFKKVSECDFWKKILAGREVPLLKVARMSRDFLLNREEWIRWNDGKKEKVEVAEYIKWHEDLYQKILENSGAKIVFDSSKDPDRAELLLKSKKLDVTILHLVRDGRGAAYSFKKVHPGQSIFYFMFRWALTNIKIAIIKLRNRKRRKIFVLYKNLAENPKKILGDIFLSEKLSFDPSLISEFGFKEHHQVGGNLNLRKAVFREKNIKIVRDLRWKKELSFGEKLLFGMVFGWLNSWYKLRAKILS